MLKLSNTSSNKQCQLMIFDRNLWAKVNTSDSLLGLINLLRSSTRLNAIMATHTILFNSLDCIDTYVREHQLILNVKTK